MDSQFQSEELNKKDHLKDLDVDETTLNRYGKGMWCGPDLTCSAQRPIHWFCECGNETSGCINDREFICPAKRLSASKERFRVCTEHVSRVRKYFYVRGPMLCHRTSTYRHLLCTSPSLPHFSLPYVLTDLIAIHLTLQHTSASKKLCAVLY